MGFETVCPEKDKQTAFYSPLASTFQSCNGLWGQKTVRNFSSELCKYLLFQLLVFSNDVMKFNWRVYVFASLIKILCALQCVCVWLCSILFLVWFQTWNTPICVCVIRILSECLIVCYWCPGTSLHSDVFWHCVVAEWDIKSYLIYFCMKNISLPNFSCVLLCSK